VWISTNLFGYGLGKERARRGYERITRRSAEDPGTAGDQAEENWAAFFRDWLPPSYPIVTKEDCK